MSSIYFIFKCSIVTFLVVMLMQVKVGDRTLEQQAVRFIYGSSLMQPLQQTAESGTVAVRRGWKHTAHFISEKWNGIWDAATDKAAEEIQE